MHFPLSVCLCHNLSPICGSLFTGMWWPCGTTTAKWCYCLWCCIMKPSHVCCSNFSNRLPTCWVSTAVKGCCWCCHIQHGAMTPLWLHAAMMLLLSFCGPYDWLLCCRWTNRSFSLEFEVPDSSDNHKTSSKKNKFNRPHGRLTIRVTPSRWMWIIFRG